jgi:DNA-directed RNA polymerase specialized sigma24 family protein
VSGFPTTRSSALVAARSADADERRRGYGAIVAAYWKPAYAYLRLRWKQPPEETRDLVQEFFTTALEKGFLERYDPVRARFRTWLRVCLDGHVSNALQSARREKRGGGAPVLSLDFASAESDLTSRLPADTSDPETLFEREWVRAFLELGLAALRDHCVATGHEVHWRIFHRYDVAEHPEGEAPSYADIASETGLPVTQVTNHLHWARREYRRIVLERLRELTLDQREFRGEARRLLGRDDS